MLLLLLLFVCLNHVFNNITVFVVIVAIVVVINFKVTKAVGFGPHYFSFQHVGVAKTDIAL